MAQLGTKITSDFQGEEVVILCVLKGSFVFCSDLVRNIKLPLKVDFVILSSYGDGTRSSGEVICERDCQTKISGRNVIVVEDIVDTGLTISHLLQMLRFRNPKSLKVAALLSKPSATKHPVTIDYLGFEIVNQFVVGYGLDYAQNYRELPYVGILKQ